MTPTDIFVARQNVKRLRQMLESRPAPAAQAELERQLHEELAKLQAAAAAETPFGE